MFNILLVYCVLSIATDECGSSVGPGARKPLVGEGIQSRRLLVLTLLSFLHLFLVCVSIIIFEVAHQRPTCIDCPFPVIMVLCAANVCTLE